MENRVKILRVILAEEELEEGFDYLELSRMTDGYSGSDLKVLESLPTMNNVTNSIEQYELICLIRLCSLEPLHRCGLSPYQRAFTIRRTRGNLQLQLFSIFSITIRKLSALYKRECYISEYALSS